MPGNTRKTGVILSLILFGALLAALAPGAGVAQAVYYHELPCKVDFSAEPTSGYAPLPVRFTDHTDWETPSGMGPESSSSGKCVVTWDFGDGKTAVRTSQGWYIPARFDTTHTYTQPGQYTVTLTYECFGYLESSSFVPLDALLGGRTPAQVESWGASKTMKMYIQVFERKKDKRPPEPARMSVSYLNIDPVQVVPGQEVVASANVCNQGEESGSKSVTLLVNGEAVESQSVSVSGGACQQVVFRVARAVPGTYQLAVDGMQGQFSVLAPRTVTNTVPSRQSGGLGTAGIIAIIAVVVVLIVALLLVFRRS